jgi:hypothetical protein
MVWFLRFFRSDQNPARYRLRPIAGCGPIFAGRPNMLRAMDYGQNT